MDEYGEKLAFDVYGVCVGDRLDVVGVYLLKHLINAEESEEPDESPDPSERQISQLLLYEVLDEHGDNSDDVHDVKHAEEVALLVSREEEPIE